MLIILMNQFIRLLCNFQRFKQSFASLSCCRVIANRLPIFVQIYANMIKRGVKWLNSIITWIIDKTVIKLNKYN